MEINMSKHFSVKQTFHHDLSLALENHDLYPEASGSRRKQQASLMILFVNLQRTLVTMDNNW